MLIGQCFKRFLSYLTDPSLPTIDAFSYIRMKKKSVINKLMRLGSEASSLVRDWSPCGKVPTFNPGLAQECITSSVQLPFTEAISPCF